MINDTHLTYSHDGTPHSLTFDGITYAPAELRLLIWRGAHLRDLMLLALLYGFVVGVALALLLL